MKFLKYIDHGIYLPHTFNRVNHLQSFFLHDLHVLYGKYVSSLMTLSSYYHFHFLCVFHITTKAMPAKILLICSHS